jgi:TolA-binding protein
MNRLLIRYLLIASLGIAIGGRALGAGDTDPVSPPSVSQQPAAGHSVGSSNEAEDQYLFATELFGKKMYELAVQQYEKFLSAFPQHPKAFQARLRIGEALFRLGKYDQSVAAYQKALAMDPETKFRAEALVGMGLALFNQKEYPRAVATLREAQSLTTNDSTLGPVAANWLGEALFASENYAEAINAYEAVGKWPDSTQAPQAMYSIGFCQLKLHQPEKAAETFRQVAEKYGDSPVAAESALRAGEVLRRAKEYKAAAEQYQFILRKYPTGDYAGDAQAGLAWTQFAQGDFPAARASFQAVLAKYPQSKAAAEAPLRIADCYYSERKFGEAAGAYTQASKSPDAGIASEATYWLGMSRLELKSAAEASAAFETLATKYPKSPFAQRGKVRLADALAQQGKTDAALEAYAQAIALDPNSAAAATASYARGVLLYSAKRVPEASEQFQQFVTKYPRSAQVADARLALAQCQFEAKAFRPALATLQPLTAPGAAKGDTLAAAWFLMGQCEARLNASDAAITAYKSCVDASPKGAYAPRALSALGALYTAAGKTAEARDVYTNLSREYGDTPQAGDALLRAADSARDAGHYDEAARFYGQIVSQKSDPVSVAKAQLGLAQSLAQLGKTDAALRALDQLVASHPSPDMTVRAHFIAGEIQEKAQRAEDAVKAYQAALALQPRPEVAAACLLRVGALESQLKQYAPSETALNQLLSKYPKSAVVPEALYEIGWGYLEQKQTAKARPYFERLITEFASHELAADAAFRVAEADFSAGQFAKAAGRYRLAAAAPAGKDLADKAWYKLGWCYREMKDYSHAAEAFMKVPSAFPQSDLAPESCLRAGEALLAENQPKAALAEFNRLIDAGRGNKAAADLLPRAQLGAGQCRLKLGDFDAGIDLLRQVAVTGNGPIGAEAQASIADSFFDRAQYKLALEEYMRVTVLFPNSGEAPYAQYRTGESYLKLGDASSANNAFQKVIDGWPDSSWAQKARQRVPAGAGSGGGRNRVPGATQGAGQASPTSVRKIAFTDPVDPDALAIGLPIPAAPGAHSSRWSHRTLAPQAPPAQIHRSLAIAGAHPVLVSRARSSRTIIPPAPPSHDGPSIVPLAATRLSAQRWTKSVHHPHRPAFRTAPRGPSSAVSPPVRGGN